MRLPRVSVLLVELGDDPLTGQAVAALRRSTYRGALEVLVFRNGGVPGSQPGAGVDRLFVDRANLGFGPANNRLLEHASGEWVLLLNNDVLVVPSTVERLAERLERPDRPAAVAPQLRSFDGTTQECGAIVDRGGRGWQLFRGEPVPEALHRRGFDCAYASAACMLLRRADLVAVGGFDPAFAPAYFEDTDLCLRLARQRGAIAVAPAAVAYHRESATAGAEAGRRDALLARNRSVFVERWQRSLGERDAVGPKASRRTAFEGWSNAGSGAPRALWILAEPLEPSRSGGHARVAKEVEHLAARGWRQMIWSERGGDEACWTPRLERHGILWGSGPKPLRWALDRSEPSVFESLESVLESLSFDVIVTWTADVAGRLGPRLRERQPDAAWIVDNGVLACLQAERADALGVLEPALAADREDELAIYAEADAVIASSSLEAELIRRARPGIVVHTFDVGAYPPRGGPPSLNGHGGVVFLGNFHHPPNLDAVRWWVEAIAPEIAARRGRPIALRVVGSGSEVLHGWGGPDGALEVRGWVEDLAVELAGARLAVVPLRYGAGTKDKIAMAMRFGVPVVTTSIGAEAMMPDLARALLVADDPPTFARAVVRCHDDDGFRSSLRERTARQAALAWTRQQATDRALVEFFESLLKGPRPPAAAPAATREAVR